MQEKTKEEKKKDQNFDQLAQLARGLSHPHRLRIIKILAELPSDNQCMVSSIVDQLPIAQSTVSQHLKILKETGWIEGRIDGPRVCYCIKEEVFSKYVVQLDRLFKPCNLFHFNPVHEIDFGTWYK